jgi:hypothetical protein
MANFQKQVLASLAVLTEKVDAVALSANTAVLRAEAAVEASKTASDVVTAKVDALDSRLFNGSGVIVTLQDRIKTIEDDSKETARWNNIHRVASYAMVPIYGLAHALGIRMGVKF